jgi:DNA-binding GntR family transcriptional regulator
MDTVENLTLRERVYRYLRSEIVSSRIPPGAELQEVPLAESLGVSRGPIREALGALAAEGLVTITPRRGAVVTALAKRDFVEAYQVREVLEGLAARLAVPVITDEELEIMAAAVRAMEAAARDRDLRGFFDANAAFHGAFVEASGNRKLIDIHRRLISQMGPYRVPSARLRGNLEHSIAEHRSILEATHARDVERTVALVLEHVRVPLRRLETLSDEEFGLGAALEDPVSSGACLRRPACRPRGSRRAGSPRSTHRPAMGRGRARSGPVTG